MFKGLKKVDSLLDESKKLFEADPVGDDSRVEYTPPDVDFSGLEDILRTALRVSDIEITGEIGKWRNDKPYIKFQSNDLSGQTGIMKNVYRPFIITNFGGGWNDVDKVYSVPVHFEWQYKEGGSNGTDILRASYDPDTKNG